MSDRNILLDVTRLIWRVWSGRLPTGIDRVCLAYLDHYGPRALAVLQHKKLRLVLSARHSDRLFSLLREGGPDFRRKLIALLATAAISGRQRASTRGWIYLNVGHTGLDNPTMVAWLKAEQWKPVFLVCDLIPISHPQFCRPGEDAKHRRRMQTVLDSAASVIVISAATGEALAEFAIECGKGVPPMQVAWLGSDQPAKAAELPPQTRPYFVIIGTIEGRKNHILLLRLWERLIAELGDKAPELVVIGQRGWEADEVFALLDNFPVLAGHVRELGRCDDATMLAWLDQARAVLMPSFIEGFGIPVIEALQRGVPVIASDQPVFREIAGDIPLFIDPEDLDGWEAAVRAYCTDTPDRARQLASMQSFQVPTWEEHFNQVDKMLFSLAEAGGH